MERFMGSWVNSLRIDLPDDSACLNDIPKKTRNQTTHVIILVPIGASDRDSRPLYYQKLREAFGQIGKILPNLICVVVKSKEERCATLDIGVLGGLLEQSKNTIEEVHTFDVSWSMDVTEGGDELVDGSRSGLLCAPKLRRVQLRARCFPIQAGLLPLIVRSFHTIKNLNDVFICKNPSSTLASGPMMCDLRKIKSEGQPLAPVEIELSGALVCGSTMQEIFSQPSSLTKLKLSNVQSMNDIGSNVARCLNHAHKLEELTVRTGNGLEFDGAIQILEQFGQCNCGSHRKTLNLRMPVTNQDESSKLVQVLQSVRSIKVLSLVVNNPQGVSPTYILRGLHGNECIQQFSLCARFFPYSGHGISHSNIYRAIQNFHQLGSVVDDVKHFESALEGQNTCLRSFALVGLPSSVGKGRNLPFLSDKAKFWIKLNCVGREKLLQSNGNSTLWVKALIQHRADLKISFQLISMNPSVYFPKAPCFKELIQRRHTKRRKVCPSRV